MIEMHTIVVRVDGSEASLKALRFALQEAGSHHAQLKAVMAWSVPPLAHGAVWSVPVASTTTRRSPRPSSTKSSQTQAPPTQASP
jgi:nucleotide-binding universal stress UspA family protein